MTTPLDAATEAERATDRHFGHFLIRQRAQAMMSIPLTAEITGLTPSRIMLLESGEASPSVRMSELERLAECLHFHVQAGVRVATGGRA